ncbi:hypothetical protein G7Y89_g4849 [Cudoniella acicularis]|uniref:2EXR domain-containing protein n=1 Tax=Cudoniella acicularis TaxID=354080 RepID=A0A8H4W4J8_9HELO|nr:hypothetical protein G7Y89_g4849 [Cudoniella acicularis]
MAGAIGYNTRSRAAAFAAGLRPQQPRAAKSKSKRRAKSRANPKPKRHKEAKAEEEEEDDLQQNDNANLLLASQELLTAVHLIVRVLEESELAVKVKSLHTLRREEVEHIVGQHAYFFLHLNEGPTEVAQVIRSACKEHYGESAAKIVSDNTSSEDGHDTFTQFPDLPREVRDMIWTEALPGPRIIELFEFTARRQTELSKHAHTEFSALLRTCKESKSIVSKHLKKHYRAAPSKPFTVTTSSSFLLDVSQDIVYFNDIYPLMALDSWSSRESYLVNAFAAKQELKGLRTIAFNIAGLVGFLHTRPQAFFKMENLEKIIVVIDGELSYGENRMNSKMHRGLPISFHSQFEGGLSPHKQQERINKLKGLWSQKCGPNNTDRDPDHLAVAKVVLEFVEVKRENPPQLLSEKLKQMATAKEIPVEETTSALEDEAGQAVACGGQEGGPDISVIGEAQVDGEGVGGEGASGEGADGKGDSSEEATSAPGNATGQAVT